MGVTVAGGFAPAPLPPGFSPQASQILPTLPSPEYIHHAFRIYRGAFLSKSFRKWGLPQVTTSKAGLVWESNPWSIFCRTAFRCPLGAAVSFLEALSFPVLSYSPHSRSLVLKAELSEGPSLGALHPEPTGSEQTQLGDGVTQSPGPQATPAAQHPEPQEAFCLAP